MPPFLMNITQYFLQEYEGKKRKNTAKKKPKPNQVLNSY